MVVHESNAVIKYTNWPSSGTTLTNEGTAGSAYNGTLSANASSYAAAQAPNGRIALDFPAGFYITVPKGSVTNNLSNFTVEWSGRWDGTGLVIWGKQNSGSNWSAITMGTDGQINIYRSRASGFDKWYATPRGLYTGNWYHVAVTCTTAGSTPIIYVNGVVQGIVRNNAGSGGFQDDSSYDGRILVASHSGAQQTDGIITTFRLHNTVLSASDIADNSAADRAWRDIVNKTISITSRQCTAQRGTVFSTQSKTVSISEIVCTTEIDVATAGVVTQNRTDDMSVGNVGASTGAVYAGAHSDRTSIQTSSPNGTTASSVPEVYNRSREDTELTALSDTSSPETYKSFTIYGKLNGTTPNIPLSEKTIRVTRVDESDQFMSLVGEAITDSGGNYHRKFFETLPGNYRYKIIFDGDSMIPEDPPGSGLPLMYGPCSHIITLTITISMPVGYDVISDDVGDFVYTWDDSDPDFSGNSLNMEIVIAGTSGVYITPKKVAGMNVTEKTQYRFAVECKANITPTIKISCYNATNDITYTLSRSFPECPDAPDDVKLCAVSFWTPITTTHAEILVGATDIGWFRTDNYRLNEIISTDVLMVPCSTIQMSTASLLPRFSHLYEKDPQRNFYKFIDTMGKEFDNLRRVKEEIRRGFHIDTALEHDIDEIGAFINTPRMGGETDGHYRSRLKATGAGAMEGVTTASIKRVCELYTGIIPHVSDLWMTGDPNCPWEPHCPVGPAIVVGFRNYKQMKLNWDDTFDLILKIRDAGVVVYMGPITEMWDFVRPSDVLVVTDSPFECASIDVSKVNMCEVC